MVITGDKTATFGTQHTFICEVEGVTGSLEFQWVVKGEEAVRSGPFNRYVIQTTGVSDAHDGYVCNVFRGDEATPFLSATANLTVRSELAPKLSLLLHLTLFLPLQSQTLTCSLLVASAVLT